MLKSSIHYPTNDHNGQQQCWIEEMLQKLNFEHVSRLGFPTRLNMGEATIDDVAIHGYLRQRLKKSTVINRIRCLTRMQQHIIPINIQHPEYTQWINHIDYREQIEEAGPAAIRNEWQAMTMLLESYGIPYGKGTTWTYKPPTLPKYQAVNIPLPDTVKKMITHPYTENKDLNKHIHYLLLATFMIGLRNPSETALLKTTDVNLETGTITITEPKKYNSTRTIAPEPQYMNGRNCKSMKYWIENTRNKYTTQHSDDYVFITYKDGKPFTKQYLRMYLYKHINLYFPDYKPYVSRHWAATAKLIKEYIESKGHWNKNRVQNWLGHDKEDTTNHYIKHAETYLQLAPYDWFYRVLNRPKKAEENTVKTITENLRTPFFESEPIFSPIEGNGSAGI